MLHLPTLVSREEYAVLPDGCLLEGCNLVGACWLLNDNELHTLLHGRVSLDEGVTRLVEMSELNNTDYTFTCRAAFASFCWESGVGKLSSSLFLLLQFLNLLVFPWCHNLWTNPRLHRLSSSSSHLPHFSDQSIWTSAKVSLDGCNWIGVASVRRKTISHFASYFFQVWCRMQ